MTNGSAHVGRLEAIAFLTGAVVMVFEITGSRVLAPFLGTSVFVWTTLIGVVMASLSTGYWWGGRMADRNPSYARLAGILFAAALFASITAVSHESLMRWLGDVDLELRTAALVGTLLLFAPASTMLGMVTPFVVRLKLTAIEHSGADVGRLYAISTAGSIVGTFACGYFLLSLMGTSRLLFAIAALLLALSFVASSQMRIVTRSAAAAFLVLTAGLAEHEVRAKADAHFRDFDTAYQRVQVFDGRAFKNGRPVRVIQAEGAYAQSSIYLDGPELLSDYLHVFELVRQAETPMQHVLMIGSAGCVYPMHYLRELPKVRVDVVEIDPQMTQIARDFFGLKKDPRLRIFHEDGRTFVNHAARSGESGYDAIFIDAFQTKVPPFQLLTEEFVRNLEKILAPEGVVALNFMASTIPNEAGLSASVLSTFRSVLPQERLFAVYPDQEADEMQNLVLFSSRKPISLAVASQPPDKDHPSPKELDAGKFRGLVLTDDFAPVEHLVLAR